MRRSFAVFFSILLVVPAVAPMLSAAAENVPDILSDNGVIKALAPGTATVTVMLNGLEAVCTIIMTDSKEAATEPTEAMTEHITEPTFPAQAMIEKKSSTNGGSTTVNGSAAATGESMAVLWSCLVIIAAAGIILYCTGLRKRRKE